MWTLISHAMASSSRTYWQSRNWRKSGNCEENRKNGRLVPVGVVHRARFGRAGRRRNNSVVDWVAPRRRMQPTQSKDQILIGLITKTEVNPYFVKLRQAATAEAEKHGAKLAGPVRQVRRRQ